MHFSIYSPCRHLQKILIINIYPEFFPTDDCDEVEIKPCHFPVTLVNIQLQLLCLHMFDMDAMIPPIISPENKSSILHCSRNTSEYLFFLSFFFPLFL